MADQKPELKKADVDAIKRWVEEKAPGAIVCTVCGENSWLVGEHLVAPPIHAQGLLLGGTSYPQAMLICVNCAHTVYFNAVIMGLLKEKEEPGESEEASDTNKEDQDGEAK